MTQAVKKQFNAQRAGTRGGWQRDNLAAWRAARDEARAIWDHEKILALRTAMGETPTGKAALAWADAKGIEIIVDHTTTAGGYYWPGTGVVAVSARQVTHDNFLLHAVDTLTHEIRHAWQDYHGLIYTPQDSAVANSRLSRDLVIEGLFEADAYAHGKLAGAEYKYLRTVDRVKMLRAQQKEKPDRGRAEFMKVFEKAARSERTQCHDPALNLWRNFQHWYAGSAMAQLYGAQRRDEYAHVLGLAGKASDHRFEYLPPKGQAVTPEVPDMTRRAALDQLGRSFAGVNYLQGADVRDMLSRRLLSPGAAERGFPKLGSAGVGRKPDKLTRKIRAVQLRAQLAVPGKRMNLP